MKSIAITALLLGSAPNAAPIPPLAPVGKWLVDLDQDSCVLQRDFGTAAAPVTVGFKPAPLGGTLEMIVVTPGNATTRWHVPMQLTLQPSGRKISGSGDIYAMKVDGRTLTTLYADGDVSDDLQGSTSVEIYVGGSAPTVIAVPNIARAFVALRACQMKQLQGWGIDPTEQARVKTPPSGASPAAWIGSADYPATAMRRRAQGTSTLLWTVGINGRVSDCRTVHSSGNADLDAAGCKAITRRGRYDPAIGLDGKPMAAHQSRNVVWHLPR